MGHPVDSSVSKFILDFKMERKNLKIVNIYFDTPAYNQITKDRAAKFEDQLSAIGGTMGLLTGFSIISGVEIFYFALKIIWKNLVAISKLRKQLRKQT